MRAVRADILGQEGKEKQGKLGVEQVDENPPANNCLCQMGSFHFSKSSCTGTGQHTPAYIN